MNTHEYQENEFITITYVIVFFALEYPLYYQKGYHFARNVKLCSKRYLPSKTNPVALFINSINFYGVIFMK